MTADQLLAYIESGLKEAVERKIAHLWADNAERILQKRWSDLLPDEPVFYSKDSPVGRESRGGVALESRPVAYRPEAAQVSKRPPPWLLGMSSAFLEHTDRVDKKLQGRVLEALADLSSHDLQPRGDTVKPLGGEYKGCWRYRIGDYRLIFLPDKVAATITFLAFLPRGGAYD